MSILIDKLIEDAKVTSMQGNNGLWYAAKPALYVSLLKRIEDSIMVLRGKKYAVHYRIDVERKRGG